MFFSYLFDDHFLGNQNWAFLNIAPVIFMVNYLYSISLILVICNTFESECCERVVTNTMQDK